MSRVHVSVFGLGLTAFAVHALTACSTSGGSGEPGVYGTGGGAGAAGATDASLDATTDGVGPASDVPAIDVATGDGNTPADTACGGFVMEKATATPLNLYVMLDKSSTMAGDKWTSARKGLAAFLTDPESAGIRVGINFFPREPDATPACDQKAYKEPRVALAELPGNAAKILDAIDKETPNGFSTPIYPALGGAILEGIEVAQNQPGDTAAVLLVTDGEPQGPAPDCGGVNPEDPAAIAALAATGAAYAPPVLTFVIGLPGVNQAVAHQIAAAGGSQKAILVSATNTQAEFQSALAAVRGKALPCEFELPPKVAGGQIKPDNVNVVVTHQGGTQETILQTTASDCATGGWYYEPPPPAAPQKIVLCAPSCESVKNDLKAAIEIKLGCKTEIK
jgi:Mg-chelatase subunit ChlD